MPQTRVTDESAYVLHQIPYSETSAIVEVFTQHHGRLALLAKGAKRPYSQWKSLLLPFQRLVITFGGNSDVRNLYQVDWGGNKANLNAKQTWAAYYFHELLLLFLVREDPHPLVFDVYVDALQALNQNQAPIQVILRTFELLLLHHLGLLPVSLEQEVFSKRTAQTKSRAPFVIEKNTKPYLSSSGNATTASALKNLQQVLQNHPRFSDTLRACADCAQSLKLSLGAFLGNHSSHGHWKTRQLFLELQQL